MRAATKASSRRLKVVAGDAHGTDLLAHRPQRRQVPAWPPRSGRRPERAIAGQDCGLGDHAIKPRPGSEQAASGRARQEGRWAHGV